MQRPATINILIESECVNSCQFYNEFKCFLFNEKLEPYVDGLLTGKPRPCKPCRKINDMLTQEELKQKYRSGYWAIY